MLEKGSILKKLQVFLTLTGLPEMPVSRKKLFILRREE